MDMLTPSVQAFILLLLNLTGTNFLLAKTSRSYGPKNTSTSDSTQVSATNQSHVESDIMMDDQ